MALNFAEVYQLIDNMHLDECDIEISRDGDGFAVCTSFDGIDAADIGTLFSVPASADQHGRIGVSVGPWTVYQYHCSYTAPRRDNYDYAVEDLAAGYTASVVIGSTAVFDPHDDADQGTWVLAIRSKA